MEKVENLEKYIRGTKAYYLFLTGNMLGDKEWTTYILDKEYLCGAKVSFISNLMLSIKEDLVDKKEGLVYESKLLLDSLEKIVTVIAIKEENGYRIGDYLAPDAGTLVALIRNKFAHGDYEIDFSNNKVILNSGGIDIVIDVDKLALFIVSAMNSFIVDKKDSKYVRDLVRFKLKNQNIGRTSPINTVSEVRNIIKNSHLITFEIHSSDGLSINKECIKKFENFRKYYAMDSAMAIKTIEYSELVECLKKNNYTFNIHSKAIKDDNLMNEIVEFAKNEILSSSNLTYEEQVSRIGYEVQRRLNGKYNVFNPIAANVKHLIILDAISKVSSVEFDKINNYITSKGYGKFMHHYDEVGISLVSMFNSMFMYPFDDIYTSSGGYKLDRSEEFDFAKLDLSMVNPSVINIDDEPLEASYLRYNSALKDQNELCNKIDKCKENLSNVTLKGDMDAISKIQNIISSLDSKLVLLDAKATLLKENYDNIENDYRNNTLYFRNKAIIEGIRNSIAHGNYEIISDTDLFNTRIIFSDIYEGELTFKLDISFYDFAEVLANAVNVIIDFLDKKVEKTKVKTRKNKWVEFFRRLVK